MGEGGRLWCVRSPSPLHAGLNRSPTCCTLSLPALIRCSPSHATDTLCLLPLNLPCLPPPPPPPSRSYDDDYGMGGLDVLYEFFAYM